MKNYEIWLSLALAITYVIEAGYYVSYLAERNARFNKQYNTLYHWVKNSPNTGNNRDFIKRMFDEISKMPESKEPSNYEKLQVLEIEYMEKFNTVKA